MLVRRVAGFYFNTFFFNIESQPQENTHILVCNPHNGKAADNVAPPIVDQKFIASNYQEQ